MKTWLHKALSALALVMAVALLGPAPLVAQASNDGPVGVDTSSTSAAALAALYNSTIPGGMSAVQTGINMQNNPGALPPPVDPYLRDALGNLLLDAAGQPIKKPADQYAREVAERQLAIDMAKAAATLAGPANTSTGGSPVFRETTADKVPLTGTNWTTGETEHPFSGLHGEHADLGARLGLPTGTGLWRTTHASGLTVANGRVSVSNQGTGQAGVQAVVGLLGGSSGAPVIGNPSNPTIINIPPVCKCCGAPIHPRPVINYYKTSYGKGYGMMVVHEEISNCRDTPCNYTVCDTSYSVDSHWFGPGVDAGFAFGFNVMDSGCSRGGSVEYYTQGTWNSACPNFRFVSDVVEIAAANLPALLDGYNYYSCAGEIREPVYGMADVCDNGHRQDWPCGPGNHDWGK